jgi:O-antigen/teichoic acid export membrane protein
VRNERRILLNTTVLSAAEGLGQVGNFILLVSFARAFGATTLSYYSVSMAVGAVAALFVSQGTQQLLIREISRNPACARDWIGVLFPAQLALATIAWIAACVASVVLIGDRSAITVVLAVCGYQILLRLASLLLTQLRARELMFVSSVGDLCHRVLALLVGLAAIGLGASAGTVVLGHVAGALTLIAFAWVQGSRRFGRPKLRIAPAEAVKLFRLGRPFFGIAALAVIYARGATIMMGALATAQAVALYTAADRLMGAAALAPAMFNSALYPALARVASTSFAEAKALTARCLRLLLVAAVPLAALTTIFASDIVRLLFGPAYVDAAHALQLLAWTLPVRGAQSLLGSQLAAMNREAALARARSIGLGVFLVLAPLLILRFGYVGAAAAVLVCDSIQLGLYFSMLYKTQDAPTVAAAFLAPGIAAAAALAVGVILADSSLSLRLVSVVLVMLAGMWGFGAIKLGDLRFLRALLSSKG